jgi:subtilisin family serine protease
LVTHQRADHTTSPLNDQITLSSAALASSEARAYRAQLVAEHTTFKAVAAAVAPDSRINTEYHTLLNAVSIEALPEEIEAIAKLPDVRRLRLTKEYRATLNRSVPLIHAPAMWQRLGGAQSAGAGLKIAILDSGIDISNLLFSDAGFTAPPTFPRGDLSLTNNKVIVAKAFLEISDATPADEFGHGTHVAGIAAGDFNTASPLGPLAGVAPGAYLGNYRVLDGQGRGRDDFIIRALEEAVEDGFDIINLSFGGNAEGGMSALDMAVENAVAAGAVVVAAAGNDGEDGQSTISSPGIAPSAITVGASTNTRVIGPGTKIALSGTAAPLAEIDATSSESDQPAAAIYSGAIKDGFAHSITDPSGFAVANGTSQAAPHVAGATALVKQMHPSWNPAQIKSALMNSAAKFNGDISGTTTGAGVLDAGAGRLDLARAAAISATLAPASLSLGIVKLKKAGINSTIDFRITNVAGGPNSFTINIEPADASEGFNLTPKTRTLALEAGQTTTLKIKLRAIGGVAQWRDYTGYLVITDCNGETLRAVLGSLCEEELNDRV